MTTVLKVGGGGARLGEPAREAVRYDYQPYCQAVSRPASPFLTPV